MEQIKTIIKPSSRTSLNLKELWQYRELLYFFAWRDIKVRYKQTALGILWALLQPLGLMLVFVLVFSRSSVARAAGSIPYEIFVLSGLVLWNLFYTSVSHAADSMIANAGIIKKIYFPRLIVPMSALAAALVDFLVAFTVFIVFCLAWGQPIHFSALLYFPAALAVVLLSAFGLGTLLGALNVKFRDFRYALPFLLQFLFFATQVIYPLSLIGDTTLRYILALNPVNAAVALLRYPLDGISPEPALLLTGIAASILLALAGLAYFRKTESYFADIV